jgi:hypothetical protein
LPHRRHEDSRHLSNRQRAELIDLLNTKALARVTGGDAPRIRGRDASFGTHKTRNRDDADNKRRAIDGELGELLTGKREGRTRSDEIIVVNPFGLALEDLAVSQQIHRHALKNGLGTWLKR